MYKTRTNTRMRFCFRLFWAVLFSFDFAGRRRNVEPVAVCCTHMEVVRGALPAAAGDDWWMRAATADVVENATWTTRRQWSWSINSSRRPSSRRVVDLTIKRNQDCPPGQAEPGRAGPGRAGRPRIDLLKSAVSVGRRPSAFHHCQLWAQVLLTSSISTQHRFRWRIRVWVWLSPTRDPPSDTSWRFVRVTFKTKPSDLQHSVAVLMFRIVIRTGIIRAVTTDRRIRPAHSDIDRKAINSNFEALSPNSILLKLLWILNINEQNVWLNLYVYMWRRKTY